MLSINPLQIATVILSLSTVTQQVDIRIERTWTIAGEAESFIAATCLNIAPGQCCKPPIRYPDVTTRVSFRRLLPLDIAAVWRNEDRLELDVMQANTGCSGPLIASRPGPGTWTWHQPSTPLPDRYAAQGASYIRLPLVLPPDVRIAYSLIMQGLLGLIWTGGTWFASPVAEKLLRAQNRIYPKERSRRILRSAAKGDVYARPPSWVKYPDFLEINATRYNAAHHGDFLYVNEAGNLLNLTSWFSGTGQ